MNDTSHLIERTVRAVWIRAQLLGTVHALGWGGLSGAVIYCGGRMLLTGDGDASAGLSYGSLGAAAIVAAAVMVRQWTSRAAAAHRVDQQLGLKDRVVSALEFSHLAQPSPVHALQIEDAAAHLRGASTAGVLPWRWQRDAGLLGASLLLLVLGHTVNRSTEAVAIPVPPAPPAVVIEALELEQSVEELQDRLEGELEPALADALREVQELAAEMRDPGTEMEDAFELMARMRNKLQEAADALDLARNEAMMMAFAGALNAAPHTESAGRPLAKKEYAEAAQALAELAAQAGEPDSAFPEQSESLANQAGDMARQAEQAGLQEMSEALKSLAEGIKQGDCEACESALKQQSQQVREHGNRSALAKQLQQQMQKLADARQSMSENFCRSCQSGASCESAGGSCKSNGMDLTRRQTDERSQEGSQSVGLGEDQNPFGDATELEGMRIEEQLTGQRNRGPNEVTVELAPAMEQVASREYRDVYSRYKKMSDEVLEHEALPSGYQGIIKRYFESIRPRREAVDPAEN